MIGCHFAVTLKKYIGAKGVELGFHLYLSDLAFNKQFFSRMTSLVWPSLANDYRISSFKARGYYFFIKSSTAGIIRNAGIIRGRALYEDIR